MSAQQTRKQPTSIAREGREEITTDQSEQQTTNPSISKPFSIPAPSANNLTPSIVRCRLIGLEYVVKKHVWVGTASINQGLKQNNRGEWEVGTQAKQTEATIKLGCLFFYMITF